MDSCGEAGFGCVVGAVLRGAMRPAESREMVTPSGITRIEAAPVLALSSLLMVRDAVRMGVGAARPPLSPANADLAAGRLAQRGTAEGPETALWALPPRAGC